MLILAQYLAGSFCKIVADIAEDINKPGKHGEIRDCNLLMNPLDYKKSHLSKALKTGEYVVARYFNGSSLLCFRVKQKLYFTVIYKNNMIHTIIEDDGRSKADTATGVVKELLVGREFEFIYDFDNEDLPDDHPDVIPFIRNIINAKVSPVEAELKLDLL